FALWHEYASFPLGGLAPRRRRARPALWKKAPPFLGAPGPPWKPKGSGAFPSPPTSCRQGPGGTGSPPSEAIRRWRHAVEHAKKAKVVAPKSLPDPAEEELRQVLYGDDSPLNFPIRTYVDIGFLLYEDVMSKLGQLQKEVDELRIASEAAPPHAY